MLRAEFARGLKYIQRAFNVRVDVGIRRVIGEGNRNQCGEVKDNIAALHGLIDAVGIADIAREDIEVF